MRERIIGYILCLKYLECEDNIEVRKIVLCFIMSVHMEQLGSRCTDINDILDRAVSQKYGGQIQFG